MRKYGSALSLYPDSLQGARLNAETPFDIGDDLFQIIQAAMRELNRGFEILIWRGRFAFGRFRDRTQQRRNAATPFNEKADSRQEILGGG